MDLQAILSRLENATIKLEQMAGLKAASTTYTAPVVEAEAPKALVAWDDLISSYFSPLEKHAQSIGGLVQEQFSLVKSALEAERDLVKLALASKKPALNDLQQLIKPIQEKIAQVIQLKDANRPSPLFNHLNVLAEGVPALGWVVVEPTPAPFVADMREATVFYVNRVIKEFKSDQKHLDFVNSFKEFLVQLQQYVKAHHTTGLAWNPRGSTATVAPTTSAPPPPPLPSAAQLEQFSKPASTSNGNLFEELSSKSTSGLRKVEKSEMTHKNPALRAAGVVKASESRNALNDSRAGSVNALNKTPKCSLQGNKWVIENYSSDDSIVLDKVELKHVVYIYNCQQSTIQIQGKVNAVTIDNCKRVGVVVQSVVSTVDVVNCKSVQVQITGNAPTVVVDKTEGLQLYLSDDSLKTELFTAKSSGINILHSVNGEFVEKAVPEQLKTVLANGKLESVAVEHKG